MPRTPLPVARLGEDGIPAAAALLARAFHDDPLAHHMLPDPGPRERGLPAHFAAFLRLGCRHGEAWVAGEPVCGAAVWFPPGRWEVTPAQLEAAGILALEDELPDGAFARFGAALEHLEAIHRHDQPDPHWYLAAVGVDPAAQGTGAGRALLGPVLRRADDEGVPCYLETAAATNERFYRRLGFEVVRTGTVPDSGLSYWTFRRLPAGS